MDCYVYFVNLINLNPDFFFLVMKKLTSICFTLLLVFLFYFSKNTTLANNKKATIPPGDTVAFNASSYVIQPNDKLYDLLKRIPVISTDKNGAMYSQGDKVQIFLVEGKEYFSDDPAVGANLLRADKVDKIIIYWRLSDQASFTGIEDKVRIKTMNIILKKEK